MTCPHKSKLTKLYSSNLYNLLHDKCTSISKNNTMFILALLDPFVPFFLKVPLSYFLIFGWWLLFLFHWEDRISQNRTFHKFTPSLTHHTLCLRLQPLSLKQVKPQGPLHLFAVPSYCLSRLSPTSFIY